MGRGNFPTEYFILSVAFATFNWRTLVAIYYNGILALKVVFQSMFFAFQRDKLLFFPLNEHNKMGKLSEGEKEQTNWWYKAQQKNVIQTKVDLKHVYSIQCDLFYRSTYTESVSSHHYNH